MAAGIKLTREEAVSRIELKFGKGCLDFSESEYIRGNVKATFTCAKCGHRFEREWMQFSTTKFCCPRCAANRGSDKLTLGLDKAITKVKAKYGWNTIDFTNSSYVKSTVKSKFKCNICDMVFHKSWNKLISGKHACPYCAVKNAQNRYKLTLEQAIDQ